VFLLSDEPPLESDRSFICLNKRSHFFTLNSNQQAIALFVASKISLCKTYLNSNKKRRGDRASSTGCDRTPEKERSHIVKVMVVPTNYGMNLTKNG
jgi:hypothetical protein